MPNVKSREPALWLLKPLAQAVALCLVAGNAQAATAFSSSWFAAKGAAQQAAAARPSAGGLPGMTPPLAQQQKANQQLQRSIQTLNNTVAAIAAQQAAQAAGRAAALGTVQFVPDGLGEGGLKVDNSLTQGWQNAKGPQQTQADGKTTVTIEQTADKAILNWETFNVGRNTTVEFAAAVELGGAQPGQRPERTGQPDSGPDQGRRHGDADQPQRHRLQRQQPGQCAQPGGGGREHHRYPVPRPWPVFRQQRHSADVHRCRRQGAGGARCADRRPTSRRRPPMPVAMPCCSATKCRTTAPSAPPRARPCWRPVTAFTSAKASGTEGNALFDHRSATKSRRASRPAASAARSATTA